MLVEAALYPITTLPLLSKFVDTFLLSASGSLPGDRASIRAKYQEGPLAIVIPP